MPPFFPRIRSLPVCIATAGLGLLAVHPVSAQVTVSSSTTAPTVGTSDQAYLPGNVDESATLSNGDNTASGNNDNLTYVAGDRGSKGESFTTGTSANGYMLSSLTVQNVRWNNFTANGTFYNVPNGSVFNLRIGTISGTTLTPLYTTTATYSGAGINGGGDNGTGTFFTFSLTGTATQSALGTLAPNRTYFFEIAFNGGYFELNSTAANGYVGGVAFTGDNGGALDADNTVTLPASGGDFAFVAGLSPVSTGVPEPSVTACFLTLGGVAGAFAWRRRAVARCA